MTIWDQMRQYCMEHSIPILAGIELTNRCNLRCKYCYVDKAKSQDLTLDTIENILDELQRLGTRIIVLSGGDIFMREDIEEIISAVEKRKIFMILYTNGTIPFVKHHQKLKSHWILRVEITVYGATNKTYTDFCENGYAYQCLHDNLELLHSLGKKVLIKIVPTKYNFTEIELIKEQISKYGFEVNVNTLVLETTELCHSCVLSDEQLRHVVNGIKHDNNTNCPEIVEKMPFRICGAGKYSLCIDHRGEIKACFISHDSAGNVEDQTIAELWYKSDYFRKRRHFHGLEACRSCEKRLMCFSCAEMLITENSAIVNGDSELCRQAMIRKEVFGNGIEKV